MTIPEGATHQHRQPEFNHIFYKVAFGGVLSFGNPAQGRKADEWQICSLTPESLNQLHVRIRQPKGETFKDKMIQGLKDKQARLLKQHETLQRAIDILE